MIYGIGTDLLKIESISTSVQSIDDPFVTKTYTGAEITMIESHPVPLFSYATRFSGKEAVFKALNISDNDIYLSEIEILERENGQPFVTLHGNAKRLAADKKIIHIHITLSYDSEYAVSFAAAEC